MNPLPDQNRLLARLPSRAFKIVRSACDLVELKAGDVLSKPGERIRSVFFPTESVVSMVATVSGNATLEVALIGDEGLVGLPVLLGADAEPLLTLVQQSGEAWRIKAATFKRLMDDNRALRRVVHNYAFMRVAQIAQNTACVKVHVLEARLARWLLTMQDKSYSRQFSATQQSLASMLGVRRSTITLLAVSLQRKNIIEYTRGAITILDRKSLKALSCECYGRTAVQSR